MQPRPPVVRAGRIRAGELATISALSEQASGCELCRLCRDRTRVVVGSGPADAEVLVVAEAPGYHDDREGRLLAGAPGELFATMLEHAGLRLEDVYLTSVVKCRPPTGRTPFPDEVEACEGWLFREIALVQPRVVVTLGALALRLVTGRQERLPDVHGAMLHAHVQGRDVVVWPMFHPGAALHVRSLVEELHADARSLGRLLRGARASMTRDTPTSTAAAAPAGPAPVVAAPALPPVADGGEPQLALEL